MEQARNTEAAGSAPPAVRRQHTDIVLLTTDDELLIELGPCFDEHFRLRPIDTADDIDTMVHARRAIVVLDVRSAPESRRIYAELSSRHGQLPIIVIAPAAERGQWEAAAHRGAICALVEREEGLVPGFEAALRRAMLQSESKSGAPDPAAGGTPAARAPAGPSRQLWLVVLAAAAALALVAWWQLARRAAPVATVTPARSASVLHPTPLPTTTDIATTSDTRSVEQLLSAARVAFSEQHFLEPAGTSALDLFAQVLRREPANAEARDGVTRLFGIIASRADAVIKAGRFDEAEGLLAAVRAAAPDSALAQDLGRSLTTERPRWLVGQVRQDLNSNNLAAAERHLAELNAGAGAERRAYQELQRELDARQRSVALDSQFNGVRAAIAAGNLIEPASGNAHALLGAIAAADRHASAGVALQRELQSALLDRARGATRDGKWDVAERFLAAAGEYGATPELADVKQALQAAQQADTERASARAAAALAAANGAAAAKESAAPAYAKTRVRHAVEAEYPQGALRQHLSGTVELRFALKSDGTPYDVAVVKASAPGVFDAAAIAAVRKWRFELTEPVPASQVPIGHVLLNFKEKE